ncbi:MAG: DNA primase [Rhodobacteraceae bacterium]|nr:DNA primase [Paracoccaceae bacterium]MCY4141070.1 DNA primase [Paracoccaceae bacterium]
MIPEEFLDQLRARVSISEIVGRSVTWDSRRSKPARGEYWALCPFHQEKIPSFRVDDERGHYYCFGCQASGDAIAWLRASSNVGFLEAVEMLARDAGMDMPALAPNSKAKADRLSHLVGIVEQAQAFFRLQLNAARGTRARKYLEQREITTDTAELFGIGYAPNDRSLLSQYLTGKGVSLDDLIETGLVVQPDDGKSPYDRFRDRIMFPIRDPQGRCIAFGGRALNRRAPAKYMNSPASPVFDKGRTLFNLAPARSALGGNGQLIVVEGYMDVVALVSAGIANTVAPLGTSITESQLRVMWRTCPELVITLDGDEAGHRAAMRLIDLALPLLEPGRALRFVMMPDGKDPDDFIREKGADAMRTLLADSRPMVDLLWQREIEGRQFDSPERRASLEKALEDIVGRIPIPLLRDHYRAEMRVRQGALFGYDVQRVGSGATTGVEPRTERLVLYTASNDDPEGALRECGAVTVELAANGALARLTVEHDDLFPGSVMVAVVDPEPAR